MVNQSGINGIFTEIQSNSTCNLEFCNTKLIIYYFPWLPWYRRSAVKTTKTTSVFLLIDCFKPKVKQYDLYFKHTVIYSYKTK